MGLDELHREVQKQGSFERAKGVARFFKTGKGEYGEGDIFLGLTVPQSRKIASKYKDLPLSDIEKLLSSKIHEERLIALLLLVHNFKRGDEEKKKEICEFYLANTRWINNWDLVDLSAGYIVGGYLWDNTVIANSSLPRVKQSHTQKIAASSRRSVTPRNDILEKLARSENVWERRIAIIATFQFIYKGDYDETLRIADILLHDRHDLIQKAVGWMLREVGKRCSQEAEEEFLKTRYKTMPRTMLRYAIERFPENKRKAYLKGEI